MTARIGAALVVLALCGCSGDDRDPAPAEPVERAAALGEAQVVGQRIISGFEGERPPRSLRRRIAAGRLAGVILFEDNFGSLAEARSLTRHLQAIPRPADLDDPLLVMADQEGGSVRRLAGPPGLAGAEMGAAGRWTCGRQGSAAGNLLASAGINVDLAPVLDLARPGGAIAAEGRSFGAEPERVASCGEAFAAGLERAGVAATAKHFPGLGAATVNTDDAPQRIELSRRSLRSADEVPFAAFASSGAPGRLVMLSSAVYPAFGERPAALTARLATGELRDRIGFEGVSITDALETASTNAVGGPVAAAEAAARAGVDLLLFTTPAAAAAAERRLRASVGAERAEFEPSVDRVLALRASLRRVPR
jgi:beta-N-acetylhexosaminidase